MTSMLLTDRYRAAAVFADDAATCDRTADIAAIRWFGSSEDSGAESLLEPSVERRARPVQASAYRRLNHGDLPLSNGAPVAAGAPRITCWLLCCNRAARCSFPSRT